MTVTPTDIQLSNVKDTSITATIVDSQSYAMREITYSTGTSPTDFNVANTLLLNPPTKAYTFTGLAKSTKYNFWARGRDSAGNWSGYTAMRSATTYAVYAAPVVPLPVTFSNIRQTAVHAAFTQASSGSDRPPVLEWQMGYSLSNSSASATLLSSYDAEITGLSVGQVYYFWSRGRNVVGWSAWSSVRSVTLVAGALIKVGTAYKRAVPYVKVNGVWKMARTWAKSAGTWKGTT